MLANIGTLVLAFSAAVATVGAASIEERANDRPHNAKKYFDDADPKLAEYIYFGGLGKYAGTTPETFCPWWNEQAKTFETKRSTISSQCVIVDYKNSVAAVYATQYNGDGSPLSQTGPVGYSMNDIAFVTVKTGPYYKSGGTCEKIVGVRGWCRNKFVPNYGVDLSTVDADGNDVDTTDSASSASSDE